MFSCFLPLVLSLNCVSDRSESDSLIVSCSNGNLSHLVPDDSGELLVDQAWGAHDYEPWITAFDLWRPEVVWSGE